MKNKLFALMSWFVLFYSTHAWSACTNTAACDVPCNCIMSGCGASSDGGVTCYTNNLACGDANQRCGCNSDATCCSGTGYKKFGICYSDSLCTSTSCGCGVWPGCAAACGGTGYSADSGMTCYPTSACSPSVCMGGGGGGAPELPSTMRFIAPLFAILGGGLLLHRARKKTKSNKSDSKEI